MADREHRARIHRDAPILGVSGPELALRPVRALQPASTSSDFDHEFRDQQDELLQQLASHYEPDQGFDLLISTFEKTVDGSMKATFRDGRRLHTIDEAAVKPKVGMTFLPGADTPQVNQLEALSMAQATPDQKDAAWRVTTAGALLFNTTVHEDMTISFVDNTAAVVGANRKRMSGDGPFTDPSISPREQRALALRRSADRIVTIDSENVSIVNDLRSEKWDLEAVLVEVDQGSLMDLISNYQRVITRGGPDLPTTETIQLLDVMIEDARRLCIRSPILFRMSTRRQIVASKNTRYGVDDGMMFKTLTTSAGIKHIIRVSSSYFDSLPQDMLSSNEKQLIQSEVRPRFFQMLVLLLSLLNDDDLSELAGFLEDTYGILADRRHLEQLILKVLPLKSINSKIFLTALVTAFDGPLISPSSQMAEAPIVWDIFLLRLLEYGYILPGTIDQLGCEDRSWVLKWPKERTAKEGFRDTSIFKNLQYSGRSRTINEIPPVNLEPEIATTAELTVTLANKRNYTIASADLENIIRMNTGRYVVTESMHGGRPFDLDIGDVWVNQTLTRAIADINAILGLVKAILPSRPKNQIVHQLDLLLRKRSIKGPVRRYDENALPEIKGCGRLSYNVAKLNGQYLSLSSKIDGRKIHTREMLALFHRDVNKIDATVRAIWATIQATFEGKRVDEYVQHTVHRLKQKLSDIDALKQDAERRKTALLQYDTKLASEPVSKVLYQVGSSDTQVSVFSEYRAEHLGAQNVLYIDSQRRTVSQVTWSNETLMISFHNVPMRYFASPLRSLEEHEKWEELKEGDNVLFCGHYLLVVEPSDQSFIPALTSESHPPQKVLMHDPAQLAPMHDPIRGDPIPRLLRPGFRAHHHEGMHPPQRQQRPPPPPKPLPVPLEQVVNWLKVTGVEAGPVRRRGKNREQEAPMVRTAIR